MKLPDDKRSMIYGGSASVLDPEIISFIKNRNLVDSLWDDSITHEFCSLYRHWIQTTKLNSVTGIEKFPYTVYSNGTTQSFDMFYVKNKTRRFRCFRGEYVYHKLTWRNNWPNWTFIEDEEIASNDAVIISLPFSDTGNQHQFFNDVLHQCEKKSVPVLIDCCYFGCCNNINFAFSSDAITDVTFSLSKAFPVANARIGIRFSKIDDDDSMFVYDKFNYTNRLGAKLGIDLMENYTPDFIFSKYHEIQKYCCEKLGMQTSNTVYFAIDTENKFPEYNRGSKTNRLSLHRVLNCSKEEMDKIINENTNS